MSAQNLINSRLESIILTLKITLFFLLIKPKVNDYRNKRKYVDD